MTMNNFLGDNMSNNNKLVEATAEFLSRKTSSSFVNEAKNKEDNYIYKSYTNSKGDHVKAAIDPGHFKRRMTYHEEDIRAQRPGGEIHKDDSFTPEESKKHMDLAKEAYHAHTNAMNVHKSPTSTPKQKEDATRHAEHASVRYYKQLPKTLHDFRSQRREDHFHSFARAYGENHPDAHLVK